MAFNWNAAAAYLGERLPWTIAQDVQGRRTDRQQGLSYAQSLGKAARETGNVGPENRLAHIELLADLYPGADRSELQRIYDAQFPATVMEPNWGQTREDWDKARPSREISPQYDPLQDPSAQWYYNPEVRDTQVSWLNPLTGEREWVPGSENIAGKPELSWEQKLRMWSEMAEGPDKTNTGDQMARDYCAREGVTQEQCDVFTQQVQEGRQQVDEQIGQPPPSDNRSPVQILEDTLTADPQELIIGALDVPPVTTPPGYPQPTPFESQAMTPLEEGEFAGDRLPDMSGEAAYKRHLVSKGQDIEAKPGIVSDDDIAADIASQRNQPPPRPPIVDPSAGALGSLYDLFVDPVVGAAEGVSDYATSMFPQDAGSMEEWFSELQSPEGSKRFSEGMRNIPGSLAETGIEGLSGLIESLRDTVIDPALEEPETEVPEVSRRENRFDGMNRAEMNNAALDQDVDGPLITALQSQESGGQHYKRAGQPDSGVLTGGNGDTGLMQVRQGATEDIERKLGRRLDPNNPEDNITIGIHYLANQLNNPLLRRLNGWRAALAAYNAGAAGVLSGIPQSTEQYVRDIEARLTTEQKAALDRKYGGVGTGV